MVKIVLLKFAFTDRLAWQASGVNGLISLPCLGVRGQVPGFPRAPMHDTPLGKVIQTVSINLCTNIKLNISLHASIFHSGLTVKLNYMCYSLTRK